MSVNLAIGRASLTIVWMTLVLYVFGFLKSILIANFFGTSSSLDIFYVALIIPTLTSTLVVGGIHASIIPVYIEHKVKKEDELGSRIFNKFITLTVLSLILCCILVVLFAHRFVPILFPGLSGDQVPLAIRATRMVAPILIIEGMSDLFCAFLYANKRFAAPSFSKVIVTVTFILYLVGLSEQGLYALIFGLLTGSIFRLLFIALYLYRENLRYHVDFRFIDSTLLKVISVAVPMLGASMFGVVNLSVDQVMASVLGEGSISALNYAHNLNNFPIQIFMFAVGTAMLPYLSTQAAEGKVDQLRDTFSSVTRMAVFFLCPLVVGIIVLGRPLIRIFYEHGMFLSESTIMVYKIWVAYSLGLVIMAVGIFVIRIFVSLQDTVPVMYVGIMGVILNAIFNYLFMRHWQVVGIALSTSVVYVFTTGALLYRLRQRMGPFFDSRVLESFLKFSTATVASGLAMYGIKEFIFPDNGGFLRILIPGAIGVGVYLCTAKILNLQEMATFFRFFLRLAEGEKQTVTKHDKSERESIGNV